MQKRFIITLVIMAVAPLLFSFCGFYVSKADGTLKNKTSQVILVRDGNRSVITMYNDYKGDTKDFAMVVPVPVVLKKEDIKVVDQAIFQKLNDYSAPRLVEYYDENPCNNYEAMMDKASASPVMRSELKGKMTADDEARGVKIEAKYLVGEYDILILSAKESGGLKAWLNENGYKIPEGAEEVLNPYIKDNMKFFVVKVNEEEKKKLNSNFLRPIQISFASPKFMLPIRLGMANADGDQDLIVYAFTRKGRVEATNYRNVSLVTGRNIPLFVKQNFGAFYSNLFTTQWQKENKAVSFLEYAWDVTPVNPMKCDPCVGNPPNMQDLVQSGVWWMGDKNWQDYSDLEEDYVDGGSKNVYFSRLHFRYNKNSFPQDLSFQVTPNTENYQARYIVTHPANGDFDCAAGKKYLQDLKQRRRKELQELTALTGTNLNNWQDLVTAKADEELSSEAQYASLIPEVKAAEDKEKNTPVPYFLLGAAVLAGAVVIKWRASV